MHTATRGREGITSPRSNERSYLSIDGNTERSNYNCNYNEKCFQGIMVAILASFLLILLTCIFSLTFIPYNQYALTRSYFGTVHPKPVLKQGVYFLSPFTSCIYFPSTLIEDNFDSTVFTESGLVIVMKIRYYYQLNKNNLYDVYDKFSLDYDQTIQKTSKKIIKDVSAEYSVKEFLNSRNLIESNISLQVTKQLYSLMGIISKPEYLKITNIVFPDNIIDNSLKSALAIENVQLEQEKQDVNSVVIGTSTLIASISADGNLIYQNSIAESNRIKKISENKAYIINTNARNDGLKQLFDKLKIKHSHEKEEIIKFMNLLENNNKTIFEVNSNLLLNI